MNLIILIRRMQTISNNTNTNNSRNNSSNNSNNNSSSNNNNSSNNSNSSNNNNNSNNSNNNRSINNNKWRKCVKLLQFKVINNNRILRFHLKEVILNVNSINTNQEQQIDSQECCHKQITIQSI